MEFKAGYDARNLAKEGNEVVQYCTIQGTQYARYAVELIDKVGRVIGYRITSKLTPCKYGKLKAA